MSGDTNKNLPAKKQNVTIEVLQKNFVDLKENNIKNFEAKISEAIKAHPFVEITDSKTYEEAKKNRTATKGVRTEIQHGDKALGSLFSKERKDQKKIAEDLIEKIKPTEDKQQEEINRWENKRKLEKERKEQEEQDRQERHKKQIEDLKQKAKSFIDEATFLTIKQTGENIVKLFESGYDLEEFEILLDTVEEEAKVAWESKIVSLNTAEQKRVQDEKDAQQSKLNEFKIFAFETIDEATTEDLSLVEIITNHFANVDFDFGEFEADFMSVKASSIEKAKKRLQELKEQAEKDAELKKLKDEQAAREKKEKEEEQQKESIEAETKELEKFKIECFEEINSMSADNDFTKKSNSIMKRVKDFSIIGLTEDNKHKFTEYVHFVNTDLWAKLDKISGVMKKRKDDAEKKQQERIDRLAGDKASLKDFVTKVQSEFSNLKESFVNENSQPETLEFTENLDHHFAQWIEDVNKTIENY